VSQSEIASAVRNNVKIKNQRRATVNNLDKATKMEEAMEKATRKLKRGLLFQKSVSKQVEELEEQMHCYDLARKQVEMEEMMREDRVEDNGTPTDEIDEHEEDEQEGSPGPKSRQGASSTSAAPSDRTNASPTRKRPTIRIVEPGDDPAEDDGGGSGGKSKQHVDPTEDLSESGDDCPRPSKGRESASTDTTDPLDDLASGELIEL